MADLTMCCVRSLNSFECGRNLHSNQEEERVGISLHAGGGGTHNHIRIPYSRGDNTSVNILDNEQMRSEITPTPS